MAIRPRGPNTSESLAANKTSITASGLEALVDKPCFLHSVVISESDGAAKVKVQLADATTSGTRASLQVSLASGAAVNPRTEQVTFNPPIKMTTGIFASSTGTNLGVVTVTYNT